MPRVLNRQHVHGPTLGLDSRMTDLALDPRMAADVLNFQLDTKQDILRKRPGTYVLGKNMPLDGAVMHLDQFFKMNGSQWPIAITTKRVYYYDVNEQVWVDISPDGGLHGTISDQVISDIVYDRFVFTNGVDPVMQWMGPPDRVQPLPGNIYCKAVRKFAERLIALGDPDEPQLVRWTAPGTADDWASSGSGGAYLAEGVDWIVTGEILGPVMVVYKERSLVTMTYVGYPNIFRFDPVGVGIGLAAPKAVVNLGNEHIFLGWDNIYSYQGGRSVDSIGDAIQLRMFASINPKAIRQSQSIIVEERNELWFVVPTGDSEIPNEVYVLNYANNRWFRHSFECTAFGYWDREASVTWDSIQGTWDEQTARWDDRTLLALSPTISIGRANGFVESMDDNSLMEGRYEQETVQLFMPQPPTYPVSAYFVTKMFGGESPATMKRWLGLECELMGSSVVVEYSVDGVDWKTLGVIKLTSDWRRYRIDFDVAARTIQFRFSNSVVGSDLQIRAFAPIWFEEGRDV